jgi:AcrR family transcriptional regulator
MTLASSDPPRDRASEARARAAHTKRVRTRAALLGAADPAFAARGWAHTRVEDIAKAAGVSSATAYNHFPSKHALIGHVYAPLMRSLRTQATRDIAAGRPVVPALTDQVQALVRLAWRHRGLTTALAAGIAEYAVRSDGPPDPTDHNDPRVLAPMPAALADLIEHGQRTGQLRCRPAAADLADAVVSVLLGRIIERPHEPPEATAELLLTLLFGTLRPDLAAQVGHDERPAGD